jgi:hypothetical protein
MRTLLLCCALALGGCATTDRHSVLPPVTAKIPQSLRQACVGVIDIPDRDLTVAEASRLWAHDRKALGTCMRRHAALSKAVSILEAGK